MKTDRIDLDQVHNVMHQENIDFIFGPRGLIEMIEKVRKAGKIRHPSAPAQLSRRLNSQTGPEVAQASRGKFEPPRWAIRDRLRKSRGPVHDMPAALHHTTAPRGPSKQ